MPKNKGKGGKNRRKGKTDGLATKRELLFKEDEQEYGKVLKLLGNCNVSLECADKIARIGHIRGAMRKKVWIKMHDVLLLSLRDFQDEKADVIHVYDADEVRMLFSYDELPKEWNDMGGSSLSNTEGDINIKQDEHITFEIDDI